jgi:hypothetical protein
MHASPAGSAGFDEYELMIDQGISDEGRRRKSRRREEIGIDSLSVNVVSRFAAGV